MKLLVILALIALAVKKVHACSASKSIVCLRNFYSPSSKSAKSGNYRFSEANRKQCRWQEMTGCLEEARTYCGNSRTWPYTIHLPYDCSAGDHAKCNDVDATRCLSLYMGWPRPSSMIFGDKQTLVKKRECAYLKHLQLCLNRVTQSCRTRKTTEVYLPLPYECETAVEKVRACSATTSINCLKKLYSPSTKFFKANRQQCGKQQEMEKCLEDVSKDCKSSSKWHYAIVVPDECSTGYGMGCNGDEATKCLKSYSQDMSRSKQVVVNRVECRNLKQLQSCLSEDSEMCSSPRTTVSLPLPYQCETVKMVRTCSAASSIRCLEDFYSPSTNHEKSGNYGFSKANRKQCGKQREMSRCLYEVREKCKGRKTWPYTIHLPYDCSTDRDKTSCNHEATQCLDRYDENAANTGECGNLKQLKSCLDRVSRDCRTRETTVHLPLPYQC